MWEAKVGRLKLYLLDSNDPRNMPMHRGITSELYGGGPELRLQQELMLGIAGWRLLKQLGQNPEVCHLNEGHAAFAVLERALSFMEENSQPFDVALAATRAGNLFTTHTPVAAGFDRFSPALMNLYLNWYATERLHISFDDLMALGRANPDDPDEPFNMAYLAMHGAGAINGVSKLHGAGQPFDFSAAVSTLAGRGNSDWQRDQRRPYGELDSEITDHLWSEVCGKDCWLGTTEGIGKKIRAVP